jgi:LysR family glycine cleavage system transcriptional activator
VADHALDAASEGMGVVLAYKMVAARDIVLQRLVAPFGPEIPVPGRAYYFVCARGQEKRAPIKAFRDWLFAEIGDTFARLGCDPPGTAKAAATSSAIEPAHEAKRRPAPRRGRAKEETT